MSDAKEYLTQNLHRVSHVYKMSDNGCVYGSLPDVLSAIERGAKAMMGKGNVIVYASSDEKFVVYF